MNFPKNSTKPRIFGKFRGPASSQLYNSGGGLPGKKIFFLLKSMLRPLATRIPSLGRVGQCAWGLGLPQIRKCHFLSDPCMFGYIF